MPMVPRVVIEHETDDTVMEGQCSRKEGKEYSHALREYYM